MCYFVQLLGWTCLMSRELQVFLLWGICSSCPLFLECNEPTQVCPSFMMPRNVFPKFVATKPYPSIKMAPKCLYPEALMGNRALCLRCLISFNLIMTPWGRYYSPDDIEEEMMSTPLQAREQGWSQVLALGLADPRLLSSLLLCLHLLSPVTWHFHHLHSHFTFSLSWHC